MQQGIAPIKKAEVFVFRAPIEAPVRTSFGIMHDRPAVVLRIEDEDGCHGWGETWCNFPTCGAEHRGRLLAETILPHVAGGQYASALEAVSAIRGKLHILRLQCDEPGPLDQSLAGLDIALWDLRARKTGLPLHKLLGDAGMTAMPAYASGINHPDIEKRILAARKDGYRTFKIKVGFGAERDIKNIETALACLESGEHLAVDVNQGWNLEQALESVAQISAYPLLWIEEPLPCDSPNKAWTTLAKASPVPLAGGENIRSKAGFDAVINNKIMKFIQPDVCKWGGLSLCREVARKALENSLSYCPHYLGGGIGLVASAHLLAAMGGPGMLEVDCNPNPLRKLLATPFPQMSNGLFQLADAPGLGVEPDRDELENMLTYYKLI